PQTTGPLSWTRRRRRRGSDVRAVVLASERSLQGGVWIPGSIRGEGDDSMAVVHSRREDVPGSRGPHGSVLPGLYQSLRGLGGTRPLRPRDVPGAARGPRYRVRLPVPVRGAAACLAVCRVGGRPATLWRPGPRDDRVRGVAQARPAGQRSAVAR